MSRIYFHTQDHGDAELRGSERAWMGCLVNDVMLAVLGDLEYAKEWLLPLLPPGSYIRSQPDFGRACATWLKVAMGESLHLPNGTVEPLTIGLNTALALGGDELRLLARLHAQCEIHCWIEGEKDKGWLADIIENGRRLGIMRNEQGWESVVALLRQPGDFPVVCSYSVCEQFPNFHSLPEDHPLKQRTDDERYDEFYELSADDQWAPCFTSLKANGGGLHIMRKGWDQFVFNDGTSAFNLRERALASPAQRSVGDK